MTKRKPRRKAPKKLRRPIGWVWWTAGLLSLGWIVFDANRSAILTAAPDLASVMDDLQLRGELTEAPSRPAVQAADPVRRAAPERAPVNSVAAPPARIAALPGVPVPASIVPTGRPGEAVAAAAAAGLVTSRPTPLLREPSHEAPVWVTLEAGRPLRVTGREGPWRRVETGIFTGWINAEYLEGRSRPDSMPVRSASRDVERARPVPPGAIPGGQR